METGHLDHHEINLVDYFRVINERKWYVIFAIALAVTAGALFSAKAAPEYRSIAEIEISPSTPTMYNTDEIYRVTPRNTYEYAQYSKTKISDLQSVGFIEEVEALLKKRHNIVDYPREQLFSMISAQPKPETYKWTIYCEGRNKEHVSIILNTAIEVFIRQNVDKRQNASRQIIENIRKELTILEKEKRKLNAELIALKSQSIEKHDIYLSPTVNEDAALELSKINQEIDETRSTRDKLSAILASFEYSKESGLTVPSSLEGMHWPAIENQKKQYLIAFTSYQSLAEKYGANHPRRIEAKLEVESILIGMEETIKSEIGLQINKGNILENKKKTQYTKIRKLEEIFPPYAEVYEKYLSVKTNIESTEQDLLKFTPSMRDTANNISISNPASEGVQFKPRVAINIILAFILGTLIGTGLAFLREYVDRSIKTTRHFEQIFDSPIIGVLPFIRKNGTAIKEAVVHFDDTSIYADVFRLLRTKLLYFNQENDNLKTFMVTSPNPDEGKTLTACNLALSFQKTNKKTLLVEGDLWKPGVGKVFRQFNDDTITNGPGLSNVLEGKCTIAEAVQDFNPEKGNLHILFCGDSRHTPSEIIGPESFQKFIDQAKEEYDFVIIDSPPINEKADGAIIASCCDGVILMAKRGSTTWETAGNAKRILNDIQANIMGGILNVTNSGRYYGPYDMYKSYYYQR